MIEEVIEEIANRKSLQVSANECLIDLIVWVNGKSNRRLRNANAWQASGCQEEYFGYYRC